jgi:hypothetical protein
MLRLNSIFLIALSCLFLFYAYQNIVVDDKSKINRKSLVQRHIPSVDKLDILSPFTVGNGEFAYTMDITGLQTFAEHYENGIPLGTQSQWGWHSVPNTENYTLDQTFEYYDTYGRQVSYASKQNSASGNWLRANPHRLHLGKIGFKIKKSDGSDIQIPDITEIYQIEDIWQGLVESEFSIENYQFNVETACHPLLDQIAVKIKSDMLATSRVGIGFEFPYGLLSWGKTTADWNSPEKHSSIIKTSDDHSVTIARVLDTTRYFVKIEWQGKAEFEEISKHHFILNIIDGNQFKFTCMFSKDMKKISLPKVDEVFNQAKSYWRTFWETGGAVDLSESTDPRAHELERRIILSRYLTAIQCAGSMPPQETGLTCNSWYGKFHLEMHWWHAVQFVLWGHPELFQKSLDWYKTILPMARKKAQRQGYTGVRWPKMVGFDGRESPSSVGVFLIWQQPHPIYYAELLYKLKEEARVLDQFKEIVFETAEFMASYSYWDDNTERYVLGPPLIPAQEIYKPKETVNPAFELAYWKYGLKTAQKWRERLGLSREKKWDHIIEYLSELPQNDGLYQNAENALNTFKDEMNRNDHPTLLGCYGMLPSSDADTSVMRYTLEKVMESWNWDHTWGWDYPLVAMTAARVGRPDIAIDALLMDVQKNTYLNNGHNYQDKRLTLYLPGNGGLLTAVAMMAAGWTGCPNIAAPGFPKDGSWIVKYEGLNPLP